MPRPHHRKPRTLKQRWVSERCWCNKGSLAGAAARLRMIAKDPSTLPGEARDLLSICTSIETVSFGWSDETRKATSWELFKRRKQP